MSAVLIGGALGLLIINILATGQGKLPAAALIAAVAAVATVPVLASWSRVVTILLATVLLIPSEGRYVLPGNLPFQLEPYRAVVGLLLVGWFAALLVDPRVRARATGFEAPLLLIVFATFGSEVVNPGRASELSSSVIKALWLLVCFVLAMYLIVSVVRTPKALDRLVTVLVSTGCVVAAAAVVERRTGTNLFDHLHALLPVLDFHSLGESLRRGGSIRATASAGHPIELSSTTAMLIPLAAYLGITRRQRVWWGALLLLLLGGLASGSRTGILGIVAMLVVFIWLRPRQTLRFWPALVPMLAVVHVASPGSIGGVYEGFFPKEGLIAQQSGTHHNAQVTRLSRVGPELARFSRDNFFFGEGYGTRITGNTSIPGTEAKAIADNAQILDDQWLKTLLETGALGLLGWLWLWTRVIRRLARRAKRETDSDQGWLAVALASSILGFAISMATYDAFSFTQATFVAFTLVAFAAILLRSPLRSPPQAPRAGVSGDPA